MDSGRHMTLLTGATGFVGRELVRELTAAGHSLALVVRGATIDAAQKKYRKVLSTLSPTQSARCSFVWGDVTQEGVLLGGNIAKTLKNAVKRVVHCAASVSFDGSENVSTTNRKGTVNLLHFMM